MERHAFRAAFDAERRRSTHRYLGDALHADDVFTLTEKALTGALANTPVMTIFGQRNDPLRLQRRWKAIFPDAVQHVVPKGNHFPMCDAPDSVAGWIKSWHAVHVRPARR
jgi:haloalkane dehalogenase